MFDVYLPNMLVVKPRYHMTAVCPQPFLAHVRRMFAVCPPIIRNMSAVYPPYLIAHFLKICGRISVLKVTIAQ